LKAQYSFDVDAMVADLRDLLKDRVATSHALREHHSRGEGSPVAYAPDVVVFPLTTPEVSETLRIAARHGAPVVPFGAGTSLEGHVAALHGGISVDMTRMNKVLRLSPEDLDVTVEAGLTHRRLDDHLKNSGLAFFIDPGADATIGGMAATRASGTTAVRYGTMRENVLGLTVVLADGRVIRTGSRARKSAAGLDLTRLFVGSEGTLGVITELTLRLHGRPEAISTAVCAFATMKGAVDTVIQTIQMGIPVARIELLDELQMEAVNRYSGLRYPIAPTLFFEFHGPSAANVTEQSESVGEIAGEQGALEFQWAATPEERTRLWHARHNAFYACLALRPGARAWTTDVCVPISQLADCIMETLEDNRQTSIPAPLVGHVGDGNFHLLYLIDPASAEELAEVHRLNDRLVRRALAMGGTCTGEHGVGLGKMAYMPAEHGDALEVMRAIKHALDPGNRMNPGKMFEW
jgi:D-lactate dehydrogenase (cytochrome)